MKAVTFDSGFRSESLEGRRLLAGEPWGSTARLINLDELASDFPSINGSGQVVVVIDTGVNYNHPALGGGWGNKVIAGYDFVDEDTDPMDVENHGTGVAGVIVASEFEFGNSRYRGVAPGAKIIALRTDADHLSRNQVNRNIERALQWVIARLGQYNIASINMSLGSGSHSEAVSLEPYGDELSTLHNAGVFIAAASGNEGVSTPAGVDYPGAHPGVYSIGSVDSDDTISSFTSRSSLMDLLAPGRNVPVAYYDTSLRQHSYLSGTGTSFATPAAAGAAALLKQINPNLTPDQILSILKSTGSQNFDGDKESGKTTGLTYARLDLHQAVGSLMGVNDDRYEENDSASSAPTVLTLGSSGGSTTLSNLVLAAGDADYFRLSVTALNHVTFSVGVQSGSSPRVELLNASGGKLGDITNGTAFDLAGGTYYVRVTGANSSSEAGYSLGFAGTPDDGRESNNDAGHATGMGDGSSLGGLRLFAGNADYFTFTMGARGEAIVNFDRSGLGGTPTAQLLDASQRVVANVGAGTNRFTLNAGKYYLRFHSGTTLSGTYGVNLDLNVVATPPVLNGTFNDFAFDGGGTMHVAYYDHVARQLKYVTRGSNGSWSAVRVIDSGANVGQHVSVGVSGRGVVGVAYYDGESKDLKYAQLNGSSFKVQTVESSGTVGEYASLAFNRSNRAAIAYYKRSGGDLRLATAGKSGKWSVRTIDSKENVGTHASLAMNPKTGKWAIGYLNATRGAFLFAENTKNSTWKKATVQDTKKGGGHISLAFDSKGRAGMSYFEATGSDLVYALRGGTKWGVYKAVTSGTAGLYSNLIFTGTQANIFYYSKSSGAGFVARSSGSRWNVSKVTGSGGAHLHAARSPFGETRITWEDRGVLREAKA